MVKIQTADAILESLLTDTIDVINYVVSKKLWPLDIYPAVSFLYVNFAQCMFCITL